NGDVIESIPFIPSDAVAVGYNYYLTPSGDLYNANKTTGPVASGVTSLSSTSRAGSDYGSAMINGVASRILNGDVIESFPFIPSDAVAVGYNYYLTPSGDLYSTHDTSGPFATGVTSFKPGVSSSGNDFGSAMINGVATRIFNATLTDTFDYIPSDAAVVGHNCYYAPNGDLYTTHKTSGPVATGLTSLSCSSSGGTDYVSAVISSC
ncbi:hypothetical protein, partial [Microbacterium sp. S308A+]